MKKVLVLGGGGFIGRNIVEFLVNKGDCNVTAADIVEGSNWSKIAKNEKTGDRFTSVIADFTDINAFNKINQSFDEVYMLAAVVGVNRTLKFPQEVIRINTLLKRFNSSLLILHGDPEKLILDFVQKKDIGAIYSNLDYEPYAIARDKKITDSLEKFNISLGVPA